MFPFASGAAAANLETGAFYVGSQIGFEDSSTLSSLGAAVGDLLIIYNPNGSVSTLSSGNALTPVVDGAVTRFRYRDLNSADIAGTVQSSTTFPSNVLLIYRGASSVDVVISDFSSTITSNKHAGGFTKNALHAGILCVISSEDAGETLTINSPVTFASRGSYNPGGADEDTVLFCDRLYPLNPTYVSGTDIIWSASGTNNRLKVLELRA